MNNYIQIYKDVLDPSYCKDLIHRFEQNEEHHETHDQGPMSFAQINFNQQKMAALNCLDPVKLIIKQQLLEITK